MEKPVLDVNQAISRASNDPGSQTAMLKTVKQACLEFNSTPVEYNNNRFQKKEILDLTQELLIKLQQTLGSKGFYDDFFKLIEGKSLYL